LSSPSGLSSKGSAKEPSNDGKTEEEEAMANSQRLSVTAWALALLLVACGSGAENAASTTTTESAQTTAAGSDGESTNIVFWHVYSGPEEEAINELVSRF